MSQLRWKILFLCISGSLFTGCYNVNGTLRVNEGLQIRNQDRDIETLPVGHFKTRLDLKWDRTYEALDNIKVDVKVGSRHKKFEIEIPAGVTFPSDNGEFQIHGGDINQPFDIHGVVTTVDGARSRSYDDYRECEERGTYKKVIAHRIQTTTNADLSLLDSSDPARILGDLRFIANKGSREVIESETECRYGYYDDCCNPYFGRWRN